MLLVVLMSAKVRARLRIHWSSEGRRRVGLGVFTVNSRVIRHSTTALGVIAILIVVLRSSIVFALPKAGPVVEESPWLVIRPRLYVVRDLIRPSIVDHDELFSVVRG
jgi:hypothetical protein